VAPCGPKYCSSAPPRLRTSASTIVSPCPGRHSFVRTVIGDPALGERLRRQQFHADATDGVAEGVTFRAGNHFRHNQPKPPAARGISEWPFHEPKLDALAVKFGTADRLAQLLENAATSMQLLRSANCKAWCTLARNLQLILNSGEHGLCLIIGGARRCNGNRAAGRSKLIVDPMRALAQQQTRFGRKIALMTESRSIAS
jgi:hypothetical protein